MNISELKDLIAICKAEGITKLKFGEIEFELNPTKVVGESIETNQIGQAFTPSEDEMMLYSTPFYDELIEQRRNAINAKD